MLKTKRGKQKKDLPSETDVELAMGELTDQLQVDIFTNLLTRGAALLTLCALFALAALAAYKHLPSLLTQLLEKIF